MNARQSKLQNESDSILAQKYPFAQVNISASSKIFMLWLALPQKYCSVILPSKLIRVQIENFVSCLRNKR